MRDRIDSKVFSSNCTVAGSGACASVAPSVELVDALQVVAGSFKRGHATARSSVAKPSRLDSASMSKVARKKRAGEVALVRSSMFREACCICDAIVGSTPYQVSARARARVCPPTSRSTNRFSDAPLVHTRPIPISPVRWGFQQLGEISVGRAKKSARAEAKHGHSESFKVQACRARAGAERPVVAHSTRREPSAGQPKALVEGRCAGHTSLWCTPPPRDAIRCIARLHSAISSISIERSAMRLKTILSFRTAFPAIRRVCIPAPAHRTLP